MEIREHIGEWVRRFNRGELSADERNHLLEWIDRSPENERLFRSALSTEVRVNAAGKWEKLDEIRERNWWRIRKWQGQRRKRLIGKIQVAAAVLLLGGIGLSIWWHKEPEREVITSSVSEILQTPSGSPKAFLKTSSGETFVLAEGENRRVTGISGVDVMQDAAGGIRFEDNDTLPDGKVEMNIVSVPPKGEYYVVLGDGTKVWINSVSELEFPSRFTGNIREVKLSGEAYFEVASDAQRPFYVRVGDEKIRVLGTAFNVAAYREEGETAVALLSGKVSFEVKTKAYVLTPGEIATLDQTSGVVSIQEGGADAIADWRMGKFNFVDLPIERLAARLSRWYGVTFEFSDDAAKELRFSGAVTKYRTLDYVLNMISKTTQVKFREDHGKILVATE